MSVSTYEEFHHRFMERLKKTRPDLLEVLDTKEGRKWVDGQVAKLLAPRTVTIEVFGGLVSDVKGLPEGWTYKVVDHDLEKVQ